MGASQGKHDHQKVILSLAGSIEEKHETCKALAKLESTASHCCGASQCNLSQNLP
jgi:hypothetical protein